MHRTLTKKKKKLIDESTEKVFVLETMCYLKKSVIQYDFFQNVKSNVLSAWGTAYMIDNKDTQCLGFS